jgi:hypothetical protein
MTAARYDITIDQGSDFALSLTVKESGTVKDFRTADSKSWGARAKFRKTLEDTTSFDLGATTSGLNDGVVNLSHAFNANSAAAAGAYVYDLEIFQHAQGDTNTVYKVTRLLTGNLNLRREVTRNG